MIPYVTAECEVFEQHAREKAAWEKDRAELEDGIRVVAGVAGLSGECPQCQAQVGLDLPSGWTGASFIRTSAKIISGGEFLDSEPP